MFKRILFIVVLVIGIMSIMTPMFDAANALTSTCFTCRRSPVEALCMDSQMTGMGNCDKADQCCYLEVFIDVRTVAGTCCNPQEFCGRKGRAYWDARFPLTTTDAIGREDLFGKGKASSSVWWLSCEIYDRLFCAGPVVPGCYQYNTGTGDYTKGSDPVDGFCPQPGFTVYHYCSTFYDPSKLVALCFNQNPKWTAQPPQCPTILNEPLWSMSNTGSIRVMDMTATYKKWSFRESDGACKYPNCPKESLIRHYWLANPDQTTYSYDLAEDQTIPCETACDDAIDNDLDGLIDCFDPDCSGVGSCPE